MIPLTGGPMRRRNFCELLASVAAFWPLAAQAQQPERLRRIGVLVGGAGADNPDQQARIAAFQQGLQQSGWVDGRNVRLDIRWGEGDADKFHKHATELVALAPDVILATVMSRSGCSRQLARCRSSS